MLRSVSRTGKRSGLGDYLKKRRTKGVLLFVGYLYSNGSYIPEFRSNGVRGYLHSTGTCIRWVLKRLSLRYALCYYSTSV